MQSKLRSVVCNLPFSYMKMEVRLHTFRSLALEANCQLLVSSGSVAVTVGIRQDPDAFGFDSHFNIIRK
jgi:hypothetical protein